MRAVDVSSAQHYRWGKASDGWHLLDRQDLSVIQERVPPGDQEHRHRHTRARQFFYVLAGEATLEIDGTRRDARRGTGRGGAARHAAPVLQPVGGRRRDAGDLVAAVARRSRGPLTPCRHCRLARASASPAPRGSWPRGSCASCSSAGCTCAARRAAPPCRICSRCRAPRTGSSSSRPTCWSRRPSTRRCAAAPRSSTPPAPT